MKKITPTRPSERARRVPFLDFPPGLGGAMAMTDRDLREGERSGNCFILGNWREKLEFEDKPLAGEDKKGVESFAFPFSEVRSEHGLRGAETEDAIADSSNGRTETQEMFFRIKFSQIQMRILSNSLAGEADGVSTT